MAQQGGFGSSGQPFIVLAEGTERDRGRSAQGNNIMAAKAISERSKAMLLIYLAGQSVPLID